MSGPRERALQFHGCTGRKKEAAPRRQVFPKAFPLCPADGRALIRPFLFLPVKNTVHDTPRCSFIGRYRSHRRSGNGTVRKANRTVFFGQPSGWLFFCRAERRQKRRFARCCTWTPNVSHRLWPGMELTGHYYFKEEPLSTHDTQGPMPRLRQPASGPGAETVSHRLSGSGPYRQKNKSKKWRLQK